jgi:hypothetical protein
VINIQKVKIKKWYFKRNVKKKNRKTKKILQTNNDKLTNVKW